MKITKKLKNSLVFANKANLNKVDVLSYIKNNKLKKKIPKSDIGIYNEIKTTIIKSNNLPFKFTRQELFYLQNNKQSKWIEYLIYRYKFHNYPKKKIVSSFPIYLLIELVSACNLRCVMCFQDDRSFTKKPYMGTMNFELYKKIIDQAVKGGTKAVTFGSRGEPTLYPKIGDCLDYASNKFIDLKLNTNATKLNTKLSHQILKSSLNELVFSIEADNKDLYEKIRVHGKWEEIIKNIENFNNIKEKFYPNSKIHTRVSGVIFHKKQNLKKIENFWKQYVDDVFFVKATERWDTYNNSIKKNMTHPCLNLWERMYIWFDGKCNPCDQDYKSYLKVGEIDVKKNFSIKKVWHSEKYRKLRKTHLNKGRLNYFPCDRCGF